jgi:hypothetical protein
MRQTSFNPAAKANPDTSKSPALVAGLTYWMEPARRALLLDDRFYNDMRFQVADYESLEECLVDEPKYQGWKLVTTWAGSVAGSWALMIGCIAIARAILR